MSLERRAALVVCPEPPYPVAGGGPQRTASLLEFLVPRYDLDLAVFQVSGAADREAHLPAGLAKNQIFLRLARHSRHPLPRGARNLWRAVRGVVPLNDRFSGRERELLHWIGSRRYELIVLEHFWVAGYAAVLRRCCERLVLDLHNVESVLLSRLSELYGWPGRVMLRYFARLAARLEAEWLERFDLVLAASENDGERIRCLAPSTTVVVFPNSVAMRPLPKVKSEHVVAMSGNFEYAPNADAVKWFARQVWADIRRADPGVRLRLIGRSAGSVLRNLPRSKDVEVVENPADPVMELARAEVVVVPVRAGSGTRVKILEAWAAGRPVVTTSIGAEGLAGRDREHYLVADEPVDFATAVKRLLASEDLRQSLGQAGRRLFERCYTREAAWRALQQAGL